VYVPETCLPAKSKILSQLYQDSGPLVDTGAASKSTAEPENT